MRQPPRSWGLLGSLALACVLLAMPVGAETPADPEGAEAPAETSADDTGGDAADTVDADETGAADDAATTDDTVADAAATAETQDATEELPEQTVADEPMDEAAAEDLTEDAPEESFYDEEMDDPAEDLAYAQSGVYLTAAATLALATQRSDMKDRSQDGVESLPGFESASSDLEDLNWGMNTRLGYRISPHWAAEAEFEWIRRFEIDTKVKFDDDSEQEKSTDIRFITATANGKYFLLTGRIQPYVVGGAGYGYATSNLAGQSTKDRDDGFVLRAGAGVDLYANRDVALTFETAYVYPTSSGIEDLDYLAVQLGITLRFYAED
jgi:opacity protein-like surface antigen